MSNAFPIHLPTELAYARKVLFAAEVIDAVTLDPVTRGIEVTATGLARKPIVNHGGFFVFLEEAGAQPQQVVVTAANAPYESITVAAPQLPARRVRIELVPRYDYPFAPGITAMRGSVIESATGNRVAIADAETWLQWIDDTAGGTVWVDAPTHSRSNTQGDFAAILRLLPNQVPRPNASGGLQVRLRVRREVITRTSSEFSIPQGRVADALPPFAWDELVP
jgi:hypothetical protein